LDFLGNGFETGMLLRHVCSSFIGFVPAGSTPIPAIDPKPSGFPANIAPMHWVEPLSEISKKVSY
jgi:hypothetical protein